MAHERIDQSSFSVIGTCQCSATLQTTLLHKVEDPDLLDSGEPTFLTEAQMVCGRCQAVYRYMVLGEK